jgi:hypothetical protein
MGGACSIQGRGEKNTTFSSENLNHSEDLGIDGKIIFEWILRKFGGKLWTGCI